MSALDHLDHLGAAGLTLDGLQRFLRQADNGRDRTACTRWLNRITGRGGAANFGQPATLWHLEAGDELEDGHRIVEIRRDARDRTVVLLTDEPLTTDPLPGDSPIAIARRQ